MPRRPTRSVPTVLLTGPEGHRADSWPTWLAAQLTEAGREVRFPELPAERELDTWIKALGETLAGLPDDGYDVIAHSFGCLLWLHHALTPEGLPTPARVALVAPPTTDPNPAWFSFYPVPLAVDTIRNAADGTVLVGGDNDPACPGGVAAVYGAPLKMAATVLPGAGGMGPDDGFGPWPAVLDWCGRDNLAFRA